MEKGQIIELFPQNEKEKAFKTKRIMFFVWLGTLTVVLAVIITLMGINLHKVNSSFDRSTRVWMTVVSVLLSAVFTMASLFFFAIKYRLTRKYCRMLRDIDRGLTDESVVKFLKYEEEEVSKDGVYFYTMVVDSKPLRREDITERRILVEHTIEPPQLEEGQKLKIITHGNILVSYCIMDKIIPSELT